MKRILMTILGLAVAWGAVAQDEYTHFGEDYSEEQREHLTWGTYTDPDTGKDYPRFVVLKNPRNNKFGVWQNARTEVNPATGSRKKYPGEWALAPMKYDGMEIRPTGIPDAGKLEWVAVASLKVGKGKSAKNQFGLVQVSDYNVNGYEMIPVKYDSFSVLDQSEQCRCRNFVAGFGTIGKDGKELFDLWKVDYVREGSKEISAVKIFEGVEVFYNDYRLIAVKKNGKWNMYDRHLTEILADDYDEMKFYKGGLIVYKLSNGYYGGILPKPRKMGETYTWIEEVTWEFEKDRPISVVFAERDGVKYYVSSTERLLTLWLYDAENAAKVYSQDIVRMSYSNWYNQTVSDLNAAYLRQGGDPAKWEEYLSSVMPNPGLKYFEAAHTTLQLGDYDEGREAFPLYLSSSPWNAVNLPIPKDQSAKFKEWFENGGGQKYMSENISYFLRFDTPAIEAVGMPNAADGEMAVYKF